MPAYNVPVMVCMRLARLALGPNGREGERNEHRQLEIWRQPSRTEDQVVVHEKQLQDRD